MAMRSWKRATFRPGDNAFAITAQFSARSNNGEFAWGPYQEGTRATGYRLVYIPGDEGGSLEIRQVRERGQSVIAASTGELDFNDGGNHEVFWTREQDGTMKVAVDGETVTETIDREISGAWRGVTTINRGGDYAIRMVSVDAFGST